MASTNDPAADFTRILLPFVMDFLGLSDLLQCAAVDRAWRSHAINHPTYYGDIWSIPHRPYGGTDFFLLRLSRANGRPVAITAVLTQLEPVLSTIVHHLNHIHSLRLTSPEGPEISSILGAFQRPAPILQHLDLNFDPAGSGRPTTIVMPWDFLSGDAPMLRTAVIVCVSIPHDTVPPCLAALEELTFGTLWPVTADNDLLAMPRSPRLRRLTLLSAVTLGPATCDWHALSQIAFCDRNIAINWHTLNLPISGMAKISVSEGDVAAVLALASTLQGALSLDFVPFYIESYDKSVYFRVAMRSTEKHTERVREVSGYLFDPLPAFASIRAFSSPDLADRVVRLAVMLQDWELLAGRAQLTSFPALEDLELKIARDRPSWPANSVGVTVTCPALRRLHLTGTGADPVVVEPSVLAEFVATRLARVRFPVELHLRGVVLDGNPDDLPSVFKHPRGDSEI